MSERMGRTNFEIEGTDGFDRLVIPCGDLDVLISYEDSTGGAGLSIDVFPLDVVDEPYEHCEVPFEIVATAADDFTFHGFNESMVTYHVKSIHNPETVMVRINNVRIEVRNNEDGVNVTIQDDTTLNYVMEVPEIFVAFGRDPQAKKTLYAVIRDDLIEEQLAPPAETSDGFIFLALNDHKYLHLRTTQDGYVFIQKEKGDGKIIKALSTDFDFIHG